MPIKGLTDRRRLPRLGKIRLGIKVKGDKGEYPRQTDYFVCPPEVQEVFGERPTVLRIMLPNEDPEEWASQFYRRYSRSRGLVCKGDGETASALIDLDTGAVANRDSERVGREEWPCPGRACPAYLAKQCREVMNLQFLLPEVKGIGIWQIDTSSVNSILNINGAVRLVNGLVGRISMIPLELHLRQMEVQPEGKKKIVRVMDIIPPYYLVDLLRAAEKPPVTLLLPPPDEEVPDDLFPEEALETFKEGPIEPVELYAPTIPLEDPRDIDGLDQAEMREEPLLDAEDHSPPISGAQIRELKKLLGAQSDAEVMFMLDRRHEPIGNLMAPEANEIIYGLRERGRYQ